MTQEDKQLLLADLCARLPYGVICEYTSIQPGYELYNEIGVLESIQKDYQSYKFVIDGHSCGFSDFKPYLRPMSSMTEEECDMVEEILGDKCIFDFMSNGDIVLKQGQFSQNKLAKLYDYYASIHVDYRGLIPKGLALEAPEDMYK